MFSPVNIVMPCNKPKQRGDIPTHFSPSDRPDQTDVAENGKLSDSVWYLCRFLTKKNVPDDFLSETAEVPSWSAFNSLISTIIPKPTVTAFTHIIPYPATQYDTIFTRMANFQDTMVQTGQQYGSLWCD